MNDKIVFNIMAVIAVSSFVSLLFVASISISLVASENRNFRGAVFSVNSKFSKKDRSLSVLKAHDSLRHLQMLASGVDLPLGGTSRPDAVGYVYTLSLLLSCIVSPKTVIMLYSFRVSLIEYEIRISENDFEVYSELGLVYRCILSSILIDNNN